MEIVFFVVRIYTHGAPWNIKLSATRSVSFSFTFYYKSFKISSSSSSSNKFTNPVFVSVYSNKGKKLKTHIVRKHHVL